jgi:hypothetical protein
MQKFMVTLYIVLLSTGFALYANTGVGESASGFLTSLPPAAPVLQSPADESTVLPDTIMMAWYSQIHTASYTLQISNTASFTDLIVNTTDLTDTSDAVTGLAGNTTYYWRVFATNVAGDGALSESWQFTTSATSADRESSSIPKHYALLPVCPNPFNPVTTITYLLPKKTEVSLIIYNSMGQAIRKLASESRKAGKYTVSWDGRNNRGIPVTSGLYLCRFTAGNHEFTQKMLLMR